MLLRLNILFSILGKNLHQQYLTKNRDGTVDASQTAEINSFLETSFKLYPTATEKELAYYVSDNSLPVIQKNYVFAELVNPSYSKKDQQLHVTVAVEYLDKETKTTQLVQYELILEKHENWKIVK